LSSHLFPSKRNVIMWNRVDHTRVKYVLLVMNPAYI